MKGETFLKTFAGSAPFSKMHPEMIAFFKAYLSQEKVITFQGRHVLNTHFPPFPSPAFDTLVKNFNEVGKVSQRRLFSVTLAVTNRCTYRCWHCYNAHRSQQDISLSILKDIIAQIQDLGAANVTLSGGEPLLRKDLEEIVACFDDRTSLTLNTTGSGLTGQRALTLRDAGLFALGVSVASSVAEEHDRMRGHEGALQTALEALKIASDCGLYPFIISVATRFVLGDALEELGASDPLDLIFSIWVLGYIPLRPFFAAAGQALKKGGTLAFVVHKGNSPYEPLLIFGDIVLADPTLLTKRVSFAFPANLEEVRRELAAAGLEADTLGEGEITFPYNTAPEALQHLKKSDAGTAYYEAVDPGRRDFVETEFLKRLMERRADKRGYDVVHNYITCIARKELTEGRIKTGSHRSFTADGSRDGRTEGN